MASDGELYEVFLTRRCPIWQVREALAVNLPEGHALLDLEDVWLGEAPLPGRVIGAVYEALIAGPGIVSRDGLARAIDELLAARTLPRERVKGDRRVAYDLRPFVDELASIPLTRATASGWRCGSGTTRRRESDGPTRSLPSLPTGLEPSRRSRSGARRSCSLRRRASSGRPRRRRFEPRAGGR